ncbi:MAG: type I restriction-modification system subunit M N-terminal domain-containing protein [Tannerellaceae bacterium]|nr:type I restriction-modification system subunit M N-terminal domain-containing protein [Tannerellaceae bacterium]
MNTQKITQAKIVETVWKACDMLRGVIEPGQSKDYLLTLLFLKYVSDKKQHFIVPPRKFYLLPVRTTATA